MGVIGSVCGDRGLLVVFCSRDRGCVVGIILFVIYRGSAGVGILWGGIIMPGIGNRADLTYAGTGCRQARIFRGIVHISVGGFHWW
jgi:hypothetical protein